MRHYADTATHAPTSRHERREPTSFHLGENIHFAHRKGGDQRTSLRPLDASRREAQRRSLLRLRASVRGSISQTADTAPWKRRALTGASPDAADSAQELAEQDVARVDGQCDGHGRADRRGRIRIDEGSYGTCGECGVISLRNGWKPFLMRRIASTARRAWRRHEAKHDFPTRSGSPG